VLELDIRLTPGALTVATTLRATGSVAVPVSFGFHPYLRLPGVRREPWRVALPAARPLRLDARGIPLAAEPRRPRRRFVLADRGLDQGFAGIEDGAAMEIAGGRTIAVRLVRGYPVGRCSRPPVRRSCPSSR
jgi:galactose mutarotase-like enzyme